MEWSQYLTKGVPALIKPRLIYHMTERNYYNEQLSSNNGYYFPPTYKQDRFIHATADATLLLGVGNNFYKDNLGDWICLELDTQLLKASVIYEPAAPVGNIASHFTKQELFPHIYGGINAYAVVRTLNVIRSLDGSFVTIDNLLDDLSIN